MKLLNYVLIISLVASFGVGSLNAQASRASSNQLSFAAKFGIGCGFSAAAFSCFVLKEKFAEIERRLQSDIVEPVAQIDRGLKEEAPKEKYERNFNSIFSSIRILKHPKAELTPIYKGQVINGYRRNFDNNQLINNFENQILDLPRSQKRTDFYR